MASEGEQKFQDLASKSSSKNREKKGEGEEIWLSLAERKVPGKEGGSEEPELLPLPKIRVKEEVGLVGFGVSYR